MMNNITALTVSICCGLSTLIFYLRQLVLEAENTGSILHSTLHRVFNKGNLDKDYFTLRNSVDAHIKSERATFEEKLLGYLVTWLLDFLMMKLPWKLSMADFFQKKSSSSY